MVVCVSVGVFSGQLFCMGPTIRFLARPEIGVRECPAIQSQSQCACTHVPSRTNTSFWVPLPRSHRPAASAPRASTCAAPPPWQLPWPAPRPSAPPTAPRCPPPPPQHDARASRSVVFGRECVRLSSLKDIPPLAKGMQLCMRTHSAESNTSLSFSIFSNSNAPPARASAAATRGA